MTAVDRFQTVERIVVLRALQLGDTLCGVPALRALRRAFPHARIGLIGLPWATALVERLQGYVDELIEFPGYPGMPERPLRSARLAAFFPDMLRRRWDLALQLHGNGLFSNGFVAQLGARRSAGAHLPGAWRPERGYVAYPDRLPEVLRPLAVLRAIGIETGDVRVEFPILSRDLDELEALGPAPSLREDYACLHAGARDPRRRWPPERFAAIGDDLQRRGLRVVLTGTREEQSITAAVARAMPAPPIDLTGQLSLGGLAALIAGARLIVANDTGVSHLADAVGVPSVIVFLASDPARWAPLDRDLHLAIGSVHRPHPDDTECCLGEACPHEAVVPQPVDLGAVRQAVHRQLDRWWQHAA